MPIAGRTGPVISGGSVIYACPVKGCGVLHEMGADHQAEPCLSCWREGWRLDGVGNLYRERPRVQPHPADDVHVE